MPSALQSLRLMYTRPPNDAAQGWAQRNPDEWKTGDEPMTDAHDWQVGHEGTG